MALLDKQMKRRLESVYSDIMADAMGGLGVARITAIDGEIIVERVPPHEFMA